MIVFYRMSEILEYHAAVHGVQKDGKRGVTNNRKTRKKRRRNKK